MFILVISFSVINKRLIPSGLFVHSALVFSLNKPPGRLFCLRLLYKRLKRHRFLCYCFFGGSATPSRFHCRSFKNSSLSDFFIHLGNILFFSVFIPIKEFRHKWWNIVHQFRNSFNFKKDHACTSYKEICKGFSRFIMNTIPDLVSLKKKKHY